MSRVQNLRKSWNSLRYPISWNPGLPEFGFCLLKRVIKFDQALGNSVTESCRLESPAREGWLLPGFWNKMGKFIRPFMKSSRKGNFKTENWKRSLLPLFYFICICRKKSQISIQHKSFFSWIHKGFI